MTKGPSRKQIVVPMGINNIEQIITKANSYISNINRLLKEIKFQLTSPSLIIREY